MDFLSGILTCKYAQDLFIYIWYIHVPVREDVPTFVDYVAHRLLPRSPHPHMVRNI